MSWSSFFSAVAGASATLTGLLFVGVSINLQRILSVSGLADRALQALFMLVGSLISCLLMLVPRQGAVVVGCEMIGVGLLLWGSVAWLDVLLIRKTSQEHRGHFVISAVINQVAIIPLFIAGFQIVTADTAGAAFPFRWVSSSVEYWQFEGINKAPGYWFVGSLVLCIFKAIYDAWVLLVEINR